MSKKRKIIVLSCMIALLAVTAVFNFVLTTNQIGETVTTSSSANYFTKYRTERLTTRNEELLQLDDIIASSEKNSAEYTSALNMKMNLTEMTEKEMMLETLIKAYGFNDAVVIMNMDNDNVNVITKSDNLTTDDAVIIYTIISEESSVSPENVKIIPIS